MSLTILAILAFFAATAAKLTVSGNAAGCFGASCSGNDPAVIEALLQSVAGTHRQIHGVIHPPAYTMHSPPMTSLPPASPNTVETVVDYAATGVGVATWGGYVYKKGYFVWEWAKTPLGKGSIAAAAITAAYYCFGPTALEPGQVLLCGTSLATACTNYAPGGSLFDPSSWGLKYGCTCANPFTKRTIVSPHTSVSLGDLTITGEFSGYYIFKGLNIFIETSNLNKDAEWLGMHYNGDYTQLVHKLMNENFMEVLTEQSSLSSSTVDIIVIPTAIRRINNWLKLQGTSFKVTKIEYGFFK